MYCFYHSGDLDGICSGAIVKHRFPDCAMFGINYGEPFPWERITKGEIVYMVDFSLQPFSDMVRLDSLCSLVWIDHHATAIDETYEHPLKGRCVLDSALAACELTCTELWPDRRMPLAVRLIGRHDVWDHASEPEALPFQYGVRTLNLTVEDPRWPQFFTNDRFTCYFIDIGENILLYERQQNAAFCRAYAFETELDGLRCIAANRGMCNSTLFDGVYDPGHHDAMLTFAWRGRCWTVSLYATKPEVHVGNVCKARGGGGHKSAAGFQCRELPFPLPLKEE